MKSILLVDDETKISAELARVLRRSGLRVKTACTRERALRAVQESQFDAILLEFNLRSDRNAYPRTGAGLEVVRRLRASGGTTPILILTAMDGELYEKASLEAGVDEFILKTDGIPHLLTRLHAQIGQSDQEPGTGLVYRLGRNAPSRKNTGRPALLPK